MKIAVLGAGMAGTLTALELSDRGAGVDLFDRTPRPLRGASRANEGKLHLGLVYALDRSDRTVSTLVGGALEFTDMLERWIPAASIGAALSDPFDYLVLRRSMVSVPDIEAHFARIDRILRQHGAAGRRYPGYDPGRPVAEPIPADTLGDRYGGGEIAAGFSTVERAIDCRTVCDLLTAVIDAAPDVDFLPSRRVTGVQSMSRGGYAVRAETPDGTEFLGPYDHVVNCLWESRRLIDETMGLADGRPCLIRYKVGAFYGDASIAGGAVPSATFVLGPFGDIVRYGGGRAYLSWYPVSLTGSTNATDPESWLRQQEDGIAPTAASEILDALDRLVPGASLPALFGPLDAEIAGGTIVAWGETDIDDPSSELHRRFDVGVNSFGNYHSVDTGKLTLAPQFAERAANAVLPGRQHYGISA